jgi:hypothetical protein
LIRGASQVYKVLDATPRDGSKFSRAVREVLAREVTWVMWKKGGKDFGESWLVGHAIPLAGVIGKDFGRLPAAVPAPLYRICLHLHFLRDDM